MQSATENQMEINYNVVLGPWLSVRPGVQYDVNPSGYTARPNAVVFELQTKVIF
jgi:carbohydrate-selective porin OprB